MHLQLSSTFSNFFFQKIGLFYSNTLTLSQWIQLAKLKSYSQQIKTPELKKKQNKTKTPPLRDSATDNKTFCLLQNLVSQICPEENLSPKQTNKGSL